MGHADRMAELTAYRERIELAVAGEPDLVVAGFGKDGRLVVYFDAESRYQFDAEGRLRIVDVDGKMYRAEGDHLSELTRERVGGAVRLVRRPVLDAELDAFLETSSRRLRGVADALTDPARVRRWRPVEGTVPLRLRDAIAKILAGPIVVAPTLVHRAAHRPTE